MLVIAHHTVLDPERFWKAAKEVTQKLPANLKVHSVLPSKDLKTGTCIWEADSVNAVQQFLDKNVGISAKNFCYELNAEEAMGLPSFKKEKSLAH